MDHKRVNANGMEFAYLSDGPTDGPLALCLHGFPDTAHTWRYLLPRLADAGFRAVAPFLRGYAPTSVPSDGRYDTGTLALDACELHRALDGNGDAVIIGHDWGAFATYGAAAIQPERWRRVVTAAVAPQASMADGFFTFDQLRRSWYVFFFQTPLAEYAVSLNDHAFIDRLWADWSPGFDGSWDVARVKEALASPENLTAAIGYYRAMFSGPPDDPESAAAQAAGGTVAPQPTLYVHGADDGCMGIDTIGPVTDFLAPGSEMVIVKGAGHFMHVERPDEVNEHIIRFITS
ncbi:MAG: alpha/beta hydrolase [Acidimicrobiales bacterium]|nr:alpha/beta hydrolase [Acidimicrobiales bacterium]